MKLYQVTVHYMWRPMHQQKARVYTSTSSAMAETKEAAIRLTTHGMDPEARVVRVYVDEADGGLLRHGPPIRLSPKTKRYHATVWTEVIE